MLQALACLTCTVVLWVHLDDFGASESSGGRLTGSLLKWPTSARAFLVALLSHSFFGELQPLSPLRPRFSVYRFTCTS